MKIKNKIVLVTGASKGIGKATAVAFAKEGATVIINFKSDLQAARQVLAECNTFSTGHTLLQADVSDETSVATMFRDIKMKFFRLNILINNAGIFDEQDTSTNIHVFDTIYKNNFLSCVMVTKYALQMMKQGRIVNVSSVHGRLGHGNPGAIAYSAFKAALESYTKNLAKELAPAILVNGIAPGRVATSQWGNPDEKEQHELGKVHLIARMIQPEEIAQCIIFLAKTDILCGELLTADGGMSLVTLG